MEAFEAIVIGALRVVSEGGCEVVLPGSFVKSKKMEMREKAVKIKRVLFPRPPSSCVTASPVPEPYHLSFEVSLSDRVGDVFQGTASEPQNLWTKRIMAFQRNQAFI
ncbi:hypothetical protein RHGRI_037047 [Rhododendron griersonianum]|uniref:Uncharacterized protein n=1 Tax=Rhododendron griersonianum TaxID=479676 RepID=A0AAV6HQU1_9ERIC|nr:hypothetical protein RHGRI_037047 [Rhododendron griersonianum]